MANQPENLFNLPPHEDDGKGQFFPFSNFSFRRTAQLRASSGLLRFRLRVECPPEL